MKSRSQPGSRRDAPHLAAVADNEPHTAPKAIRFAAASRALTAAARASGWDPPAFRSPPRVVGRDRTLRRNRDGSASVSVSLKGRPFVAVVADMVDGVVLSNRLSGGDADRARRELWAAVEAECGDLLSHAA